MKRPSGNARLHTIATHIIETGAQTITNAQQHGQQELALMDGYPSSASGSDSEKVSGSQRTIIIDGERIPITAVEAIALQRQHAGDLAKKLDDALTSLEDAYAHLLRTARALQRHRTPTPPKPAPALCRDGQHGKDGTIEWGDPTCIKEPVARGLCTNCYQRARRWRENNGLPPWTQAAEQ